MTDWPHLRFVGPRLETGLYRHYKGGLYFVLSIATHSESEEPLVIYRSVDAPQLWARPCSMFIEQVVVDGRLLPRFERIESLPQPIAATAAACAAA